MPTWFPPAKTLPVRLAAVAAVFVVIGGVACSAVVRPSISLPSTSPEAQNARSIVSQPAPPIAPSTGGAAAPQAATARDAIGPAQPPSTSSTEGALPDTSAQILDRMVIRTAQLTVEVTDMESALARARAIASQAGGYVSQSNTRVERQDDQGQDGTVADLTLQVRGEAADSAMSDLRALGKVTTETSGSQDVTDEYVDLDANLRNLQASEAAILKLMDRATQISDVLSLQRELTNVRGQIERIQGRKTYLERRTDMATITVSLRLPAPSATSVGGGTWDPVATAQRGWQASLSVLRALANAAIVALAFSWWLVPFAALGVFVWRRRRPTPPRAIAPAIQ
jgi:hypothetical protein